MHNGSDRIGHVPIEIEPNDANGFRQVSRLMVDKVTTLPKTKLGGRVGQLTRADMVRLDRALAIFLGLSG